MTPQEFKEARIELDIPLRVLSLALGYRGIDSASRKENGALSICVKDALILHYLRLLKKSNEFTFMALRATWEHSLSEKRKKRKSS